MTISESADALAGAVEARVASHLHPQGSFNVADHPVPSGREEVWRFTPMKRLRGLHEDAPLRPGGLQIETRLTDGVTRTTVAKNDPIVGSSKYVPVDRPAARAWEAADEVSVISVAANTEADEPSIITHRGAGQDEATTGHLVIKAEKFSKATIVLRFEGSATVSDVVEMIVEDGAQLSVVTISDWADDAVHLSAQHALIGRDAKLRHIAVSFGGDLVRHNASVEYATTGGEAEMLGLYFADANQHLEHRLFVDHNAPHSVSHVDYRGALQGEGAHTVWIGDVLIRKAAEGIDTYESNKNLVLTDGCRADSVPNLEIETGEIAGAGHSSTTGRFDDEQLFYLRSRGIDETEARRLVVHGFFADIIKRIGEPSLEQGLLEVVERELAATVGTPDNSETELVSVHNDITPEPTEEA